MKSRSARSRVRAHRLEIGAALLAMGVGGCTSVLGMDKPTLSSCLVDGCLDASPASYDATGMLVDSPDEIPPGDDAYGDEAAGDSYGGSFDGGPASSVLCPASFADAAAWCSGATPVCCQSSDLMGPTGTCAAAGPDGSFVNCPSGTYPIACEGPGDCVGGDVCCQFQHGGMKCVPPSHCGTGTDSVFVCDPDAGADASGCPSGKDCTNALVVSGWPSPFSSCAP